MRVHLTQDAKALPARCPPGSTYGLAAGHHALRRMFSIRHNRLDKDRMVASLASGPEGYPLMASVADAREREAYKRLTRSREDRLGD